MFHVPCAPWSALGHEGEQDEAFQDVLLSEGFLKDAEDRAYGGPLKNTARKHEQASSAKQSKGSSGRMPPIFTSPLEVLGLTPPRDNPPPGEDLCPDMPRTRAQGSNAEDFDGNSINRSITQIWAGVNGGKFMETEVDPGHGSGGGADWVNRMHQASAGVRSEERRVFSDRTESCERPPPENLLDKDLHESRSVQVCIHPYLVMTYVCR